MTTEVDEYNKGRSLDIRKFKYVVSGKIIFKLEEYWVWESGEKSMIDSVHVYKVEMKELQLVANFSNLIGQEILKLSYPGVWRIYEKESRKTIC